MKRIALLSGVGALAALLGAANQAGAATITGGLTMSGNLIYDNRLNPALFTPGHANCGDPLNGNPTCTLSIIDFVPLSPSVPPGTGSLLTVFNHTGFFSNIDTGSFAQTFDLTNDVTAAGAPPATGPAYAPAGVDLTALYPPAGIQGDIQKWTDPDAIAENLHFDLTNVVNQGFTCTGSEAETPGTSCAEGPFVLTRTANGIHIDFDVFGFFRTGTMGCVGAGCTNEGFYKGILSTDFIGLSFAELFKRIDTNGADIGCGPNNDTTVTCGVIADFSPAAVPEPTTLTMFGLGSLALARLRRKNKKQ